MSAASSVSAPLIVAVADYDVTEDACPATRDEGTRVQVELEPEASS